MADDFTDLDQPVALDRLNRLHESSFPNYDPSVPSTDRALFEEASTVWERLAFYITNSGNEGYVNRAVQRQNLIDLGRLITFVPTSRVAATADLTVTITRTVTPGARFLLQAGSRIRTASVSDPVIYQTPTDLEVLPDGNAEQEETTSGENSETVTDSRESDGTKFQQFRLTSIPFLDGSLVLTDDLETATVKRNFTDSSPLDFDVVVRIDSRERATILFGNGINGRIPVGLMAATYRIGGGVVGQVEANQLTVLDRAQFFDDDGNAVIVTVTNPLASTPGADRQTISELQREIPKSAETRVRTVSKTDFENGATTLVGAVSRVIALSLQEIATLVPLNETWVYIVVKGGGDAPQSVLDAVAAIYVDDGPLPAGNTIVVRVFSAPFQVVNVTTRVFIATNTTPQEVRSSIVATLETFFNPDNFVQDQNTNLQVPTVAFGFNFAEETGQPDGQLSWSSVLCAIEGAPGVAKVEDSTDRLLLNGTDSDISLDAEQFPTLGTVTVINAATGTVIPDLS